MNYVSVRGSSPAVSFREALFRGLAPDGGLYVPEQLPLLDDDLFHDDSSTLHSVASGILRHFVDEIPPDDLAEITRRALSFAVPLVPLEDDLSLLELFHGPTLAFKDVGARFMAEVMGWFLKRDQKRLTIAVATSGDTGSAVAHGFHTIPGIAVFILYPSGKISRLQEQQMTTLGGNIRAVEVEGTFDECQRLVKQSLGDQELAPRLNLTTANSINIGRLLPQITYYAWGLIQFRRMGSPAFKPLMVVPSGNFGNLTAAAYAQRMGVPIAGLVAATNSNDVVPEYLKTGTFSPRPSVTTLSNAMDVGDPSNVARLQSLYGERLQELKRAVTAQSVDDDETLAEIRSTYTRTGRMVDPHTAVGIVAARRILAARQGREQIIVAATAHPAKFPEVIERATGVTPDLPDELRSALNRKKETTHIPAQYDAWKGLLLSLQ